jgi:hypothetical protein
MQSEIQLTSAVIMVHCDCNGTCVREEEMDSATSDG